MGHVNTRLFVVPIGVIKRRFCSITLLHLVLLGRKTGYGFRILVILRHMLTYTLRPRLDAYKEMTSTKNSELTPSHYHCPSNIAVREWTNALCAVKGKGFASEQKGRSLCGGSAPQFVRVPTGKAMGPIFLIRSAPNQCADPSL